MTATLLLGQYCYTIWKKFRLFLPVINNYIIRVELYSYPVPHRVSSYVIFSLNIPLAQQHHYVLCLLHHTLKLRFLFLKAPPIETQ